MMSNTKEVLSLLRHIVQYCILHPTPTLKTVAALLLLLQNLQRSTTLASCQYFTAIQKDTIHGLYVYIINMSGVTHSIYLYMISYYCSQPPLWMLQQFWYFSYICPYQSVQQCQSEKDQGRLNLSSLLTYLNTQVVHTYYIKRTTTHVYK